MARTVYGRITDKSGPLTKLTVEAWDSDLEGDDFMGRAVTDAAGDYRIEYAAGHWDPAPDAITTWRPDIYVKVLTKTKNGRDVEVDRSPVHDNQPLRDDLKINIKIGASGTAQKSTAFKAETHGLPFTNDFSFKVGWTFDDMGFCGGMFAYALNRFNSNKAVPAKLARPNQGSNDYTELLCRQVATLYSVPLKDLQTVSGVLSKLATPHTLFKSIVDDIWSWQKAPDEGHWYRESSVGARTRKQWSALKERLDKGQPTILVLITQEGANPAQLGRNHQVVATGYSYNHLSKDLFIEIYDPNCQRRTEKIYLNLGLSDSKLDCEHSNPSEIERVRGFFVNPLGDLASA
jgi:hypothetical protein